MRTVVKRMARPLAVASPQSGQAANNAGHKLFIAIPCYGGLLYDSMIEGLRALEGSLLVSGVRAQRRFLRNESLVTRARNRLVAAFLESDCTDLLFIDADVGFTPKDFQYLTLVDEDVVCGAYPMKGYGWETIHAAARSGVPPHLLSESGSLFAANAKGADVAAADVEVHEKNGARYIEVQDAATGFLLIKRRVFERMIRHYGPDIEYTADYGPETGRIHHNFFDAAIDPESPRERAKWQLLRVIREDRSELEIADAVKAYREAQPAKPGRYLSEDYCFTRRWQAMGGKVYCAIDCELSHTGTHTWGPARVSRLLEDIPEEKADMSPSAQQAREMASLARELFPEAEHGASTAGQGDAEGESGARSAGDQSPAA
jgi:hypothetical protein